MDHPTPGTSTGGGERTSETSERGLGAVVEGRSGRKEVSSRPLKRGATHPTPHTSPAATLADMHTTQAHAKARVSSMPYIPSDVFKEDMCFSLRADADLIPLREGRVGVSLVASELAFVSSLPPSISQPARLSTHLSSVRMGQFYDQIPDSPDLARWISEQSQSSQALTRPRPERAAVETSSSCIR